ncbi:prolipoprotein diacylglyceryl transferase [Candidatus Woesearchaeota archaeon]|nr:prolipoprotein diacylglyceryl transferase [Candidatus Woesearchaeota archaeon]
MYVHNLSPYLLSIGKINITYYGLVYALGFLSLTYYFVYLAKNKRVKGLVKDDDAYDLMFYIIISSILGARFFYVLFYQFSYYLTHLLEVFFVWQGGMAFHGGLIGAVLGVWLYTKKNKKTRFLELADHIILVTSLVLGFGRIANFINAELVGKPSNAAWCVYFNKEDICRHPSQLYEAAKNFLIFGVLGYLTYSKEKLRLRNGTIFFAFMTLYGFLRFLVTFYRVPDYTILSVGFGQWLSLMMGLTGLFFLYKNFKRE